MRKIVLAGKSRAGSVGRAIVPTFGRALQVVPVQVVPVQVVPVQVVLVQFVAV